MSANLIANRYAKAFLGIAGTDVAAAQRLGGFLAVTDQLFAMPEAKRVLRSPVMPPEVKRALLDFAVEKSNAGAEAKRFGEQLLTAGRVDLLPEISAAFTKMLDEQRGIGHAVVTTAEPVNDALKGDLEKTLSSVFKKNLTLDNKVDRKILGGLVVEVGNYAIDMSVRAKLESLAEQAQH